MINVRSVALLGIGFSALLVATTGLQDAEAVTPTQQTQQAAGGLSGDAGSGYVWRDNAWIKATKLVRYSTSVQCTGTATNRAHVTLAPKKSITGFPTSKGSSTAHSQPESRTAAVTILRPTPLSHSFSLSCCNESIVSRYNGAYEALSMDEIMVLIEMTT